MVANLSPSNRKRFLWWLSTAEEDLLKDCLIDKNRYAIIGMLVLGTWTFATLAWTYFFSTVVTQWWVSLLLGIFMGGIILQIDRALIKGISRTGKQKLLPLIFRGMLALSIGLFMAQPALLFLFDKEVKVQVSIDNEHRKQTKMKEQEMVYQLERNSLLEKKRSTKNELNKAYTEVAAARDNFIKETDGTGGSKKVGLKNIALAKKSAYEKLDADYQIQVISLNPLINYVDSSLKVLDEKILKEQEIFQSLLNNGFITRIEALNHLVQNSAAVLFRYYLLVAILLLIELMPVLAKLLLPVGTYELKVKLQEEMEKELAEKNQLLIYQFFELSNATRITKLEESLTTWQNNSLKTMDEQWIDFNKHLLIKESVE